MLKNRKYLLCHTKKIHAVTERPSVYYPSVYTLPLVCRQWQLKILHTGQGQVKHPASAYTLQILTLTRELTYLYIDL